MQGKDNKNQLVISAVIAGVGIISAIIGVMTFLHNEKHQKIQQEMFAIDGQIKALELALKRDEAEKKGVV